MRGVRLLGVRLLGPIPYLFHDFNEITNLIVGYEFGCVNSCHEHLLFSLSLSRPALGSTTVDPTTVSPDSTAALATALAKSASAKNDPSLELRALERALELLLLLSVIEAQVASMEPGAGDTRFISTVNSRV